MKGPEPGAHPAGEGALSLLGARISGPAELRAQLQAAWGPPLGQRPGWAARYPLRLERGEVDPGPVARPLEGVLHGGGVPLLSSGPPQAPELIVPGGRPGEALRLSLTPAGGTLTVSGPSLAGFSPAALLILLAEVQRAAGLLPLHAAVLTRADAGGGRRTVAVTGPSGAGKSTAALRLSARGWTLLAEDFAWFRPGPGTAEAAEGDEAEQGRAGPDETERGEVVGWDRGLRVLPQSLTRFAPQLLGGTRAGEGGAPLDEFGKHLLNPPRWAGALPLSELLVLGPPLQRAAAVGAVWNMVGVPLTPLARAASMRAVEALLRQLPVRGTDRDMLVEELG